MHTVSMRAEIDDDGRLRLDIPADLPPGPVELVLVIQPETPLALHDIRELRGLGREIWRDSDAQAYVDQLRDEWEH